jgi:uncharacterized repeat protein (TIGR02543 family)
MTRSKGVILVTAFFIAMVFICGTAHAQILFGDHSPTVAYSPISKTYWSVYQTYGQSWLSHKFIDPWGNSRDGISMMFSFGDDYHAKPSLAYDIVHDKFFVAWTGPWPYYDLYGQLLDYTSGEPFLIASAPGPQTSPVVTHDSVNGGFLVTWLDDRNVDGAAIYGQLVDAEGELEGTELLIVSGLIREYREPCYSVTYDYVNQRFLVVWNLEESIFGQFINANGTLHGEKFTIVEDLPDDYYPIEHASLAYDSLNQRYLVVWDLRWGSGGIIGQLINAEGTLLATPFAISQYGWNPSVAFDNVNQRYLVAWTPWITDGQFVNPDGTHQGDKFTISDDGYYNTNDPPAIAINPQCGNFLVGSVARNDSGIKGIIWGLRTDISYTVVGDPCPAATLTVKKKGYRAKKSLVVGNSNSCKRNSCKYIAGSVVSITAIPDDKAVFEGWTGCDTVMDNVCNVTMDGDKTVTAKFSKVPKKSR